MFTAGLRIKKFHFYKSRGRTFLRDFGVRKLWLVMGKFAIEKWINMVSIIGHKVGAGAHYLDS